MPRLHHYAAWSLYALVVAVYLWAALFQPSLYVRLTYEDLYGEWLQTWLFAAVFALALSLAWRNTAGRWCFGLLAAAAFYTVMEEISWGQRIFGIASPAFFAEHNVQGETNLHNFLTGPQSTWIKDVVEYTLASALLGYGLLYPLALRFKWQPARWLQNLGVAPPPLYLWPFFVTAASLEVGWFSFNEAEVAEILIGLALVLMLLRYRVSTDSQSVLAPEAAIRCGRWSLGSFALLVCLAWVTTAAFYELPGRGQAIDARLANGYEKFGQRLARRNRVDQAADLYYRAYQLEPENLLALQKAADLYPKDSTGFRHYNRLLLDATAEEVLWQGPTVEKLLMLAENYAQLQAPLQTRTYLDQALATALLQIEAAPEQADAYYWLGRAYQQNNELAAAERAYEQALSLDPGRSRNILALRSLRRAIKAEAPAR